MQDFGSLVNLIFTWSLSVVGIAVFVMILYGGFEWMTAQGSTTRVDSAKNKIKNAILGAILLFSSYLILNTINPELVGGGFRLPGIKGNFTNPIGPGPSVQRYGCNNDNLCVPDSSGPFVTGTCDGVCPRDPSYPYEAQYPIEYSYQSPGGEYTTPGQYSTPGSYQTPPSGGGCSDPGNTTANYSGDLQAAIDTVNAINPGGIADEDNTRSNSLTYLNEVAAVLRGAGLNATTNVLNGNDGPNQGDLIAIWAPGDTVVERYDAIVGIGDYGEPDYDPGPLRAEAHAGDFTGDLPLSCAS